MTTTSRLSRIKGSCLCLDLERNASGACNVFHLIEWRKFYSSFTFAIKRKSILPFISIAPEYLQIVHLNALGARLSSRYS